MNRLERASALVSEESPDAEPDWRARMGAAHRDPGEQTGPLTEPAPLTIPGELGPDLTGPLDPDWLRLADEPEADPLTPVRLLADSGLSELDTQRLHPAPGPAGPPVSTIVVPLVGQIGRYTLEHRLGEGGLGTVWSAYDTVLARQVAIKTLPLHMPAAEREAIAERVLDEARAAARLSHPHIVTVHDAGIAGEGAYLAMELLRGKDLADLMRSPWRPTPEQAALIVRRVADALSYAHSKGVIHRDIKPANIFMVGRTRPVVLDFGIARLMHQSGDTGPALGSPYYAAPEQYEGHECDQRSDVYSLGVVLYELLCGVRPYNGTRLQEIRTAVRAGGAAPPSRHRAGVPAVLESIAMRAIALDPAQRPRSAGAMARELRAWLADPTGRAAARAEAAAAQVPLAAVPRPAAATPLPTAPPRFDPALRSVTTPLAALSPFPPPIPSGWQAQDDDSPPPGSRLRSLVWALAGAAVATLAAWLLWTAR